VTLTESRALVGTLLAFDKHLNLVLADAEEVRRVRGRGGGIAHEQKRAMGGMVVARGEAITALAVVAPPSKEVGGGGSFLNDRVRSFFFFFFFFSSL
jgi:small nuclear ribonucleoprotein B and B'